MSIADVLSDAEAQIKRYLEGDMYREPDLRAKVEAVLSSMRELRIELDTVPDGSREIWLCQCDCGAQVEVSRYDLEHGIVTECPRCEEKAKKQIQ
jgi:hypothetical protein